LTPSAGITSRAGGGDGAVIAFSAALVAGSAVTVGRAPRRGPPATTAFDAACDLSGARPASGMPPRPDTRPTTSSAIPTVTPAAPAAITTRATDRRPGTPSNPPIPTNSLAGPRPRCQVPARAPCLTLVPRVLYVGRRGQTIY